MTAVSRLVVLLAFASATAVSAIPSSPMAPAVTIVVDQPWNRRQDAPTYPPLFDSPDLPVARPDDQASSPVPSTTQTSSLPVWTDVIPIPNTLGLIVPGKEAFTNTSYDLGFVDSGRLPSPIAGGWLRSMVSLIVLPNEAVHVLAGAGSLDPDDPAAFAIPDDELCGTPLTYLVPVDTDYTFTLTGWHTFVVNETWVKPTITDNKCQEPFLKVHSFFATMAVSVAPLPTGQSPTVPPNKVHWVDVSTDPPHKRPKDAEKNHATVGIIVGVIVGLGVLSLALAWWWLRRRAIIRNDADAFNQMRKSEQDEFLAENPTSRINPNRQSRWLAGSRPVSTVEPPRAPPTPPPKDAYYTPLSTPSPIPIVSPQSPTQYAPTPSTAAQYSPLPQSTTQHIPMPQPHVQYYQPQQQWPQPHR